MRHGASRKSASAWVLLGGLVVAGVGVVLLGMSQVERTGTFGWFSAAPAGAVVVPAPGEPGQGTLFGTGLAGVGLLILAWRAGNGLNPLGSRPYLPALPSRMRLILAVMTGVAVLLVLAGASVLLGAPSPMPLRIEGEPSRTSTPYSSELVITLDPVQRPLLVPGALLLLGGALAAAAAAGWCAGRPGAVEEPDQEMPR